MIKRVLAATSATLLVLFNVAVLPVGAVASTLYVDIANASCSDTGSGTLAQPYCHINPAAQVAVAGQTVQVNPGTYAEQVTVKNSGTSSAPIVFTAPAGATVTGAAHGFYTSGRSWVTVNGFTVNHTTTEGIYVNNGTSVTISNNDVSYSGTPVSGQVTAGIKLTGTTINSTVTGNASHNNSEAGVYLGASVSNSVVSKNTVYGNARQYTRAAPGIDVRGPNNSILSNVTHDNEDTGIQIYTGANNALVANNVTYNNGDHGIDNLNVTGGRIIGNTVYRNCTDGINVEGTSGNYTVENNIAVDNAVYPAYQGISCSRRKGNIGIYDSAPSGTIVNSNLVWLTTPGTMYTWANVNYASLSAMQTATGQESHGLQADPLFANPGSFVLSLLEHSPAIDSADSGVSGQQAADILGVTRRDDLNVANTGIGPRVYDDRGAYEF